jgi:drug/metabolite transporter (DMT)-like permease
VVFIPSCDNASHYLLALQYSVRAMNVKLLLLILASVACSSFAQILLRTGMAQPLVAEAIRGRDLMSISLRIALSPWIVGGLGLYFFGAMVWLFVLAQVEASVAYPFVGIGFFFTLILGAVLLDETVTLLKVSGTLLVSAGIFLIAVKR